MRLPGVLDRVEVSTLVGVTGAVGGRAGRGKEAPGDEEVIGGSRVVASGPSTTTLARSMSIVCSILL